MKQRPESAVDDVVDDLYPLTPLQQGILFHALHDGETAGYLSQVSVPVPAAEAADLVRSWRGLVARHPVLRTAFLWEGLDQPVQVVYRRVELPVTELDLRDCADPHERLAEFVAADRRRPFDVQRAPLTRLAVLRLSDDLCQVVWTHDGLLLDGWSSARIFRELTTGVPEAGAPDFREFVAWLGRQDPARRRDHWKALLGDFDSPTPLPFEGVNRAARALDGSPGAGSARVEVLLPAEETGRITRGARELHVPFGVLAQAAWGLTSARFADSDDAVFGVVTSGRSAPLPGIERMVGLLTNTVAVRVRADGAATVRDWLADLLRQQAETLRHEHSPLAEVRQQSAVPAGLPLFRTVLITQNFPYDTDEPTDGQAGRPEAYEANHYPLTVVAIPGERLLLRLQYDPAELSASEVELLGQSLRTALLGIVADPGRSPATVPVLPPGTAVPPAWTTGPGRVYPGGTLSDVIADRIAAGPSAPAVIDVDGTLDYRELGLRAGGVATVLTGHGVRPEDRVALFLDRSTTSVVATVGTLASGAAYVPVDPAYPSERARYMIEDSRARLVLTRRDLADRLPAGLDVPVLFLEDVPPRAEGLPRCPAGPDQLAYLIYTSGSTGEPKGVMISHRAVLNTLFWLTEELTPRTGTDVVAHKVPPGFTDVVFEVLWPLTAGFALAVLDERTVADPEAFLAALREHRVTYTQVMPRQVEAMAALAEHSGEDPLPDLRWAVIGGEPLPPAFGRSWDRGFAAGRIANIYGMTESAVYATSQLLERGLMDRLDAVPMGRPLPNTRALVLNRELEPCPVGVRGELYLAGVGITHGYTDKPGLTADRLLPLPDGPPNARMYRTGDLAFWRPDGALEYAGRADFQLKVRGMRVEAGEVETVLRRHPAVRDAVVVTRGGRLAAYLVGSREAAGDLRQHLAARLADHQVPALTTWLDELPTTVHGKVDRAALPEPDMVAADASVESVPPATAAEELVAGVVAGVLGLPDVGVLDDFFALGGDSLLAVQVVGRLRDVVPVPYTVAAFMAAPTVRACAAEIEELLSGDTALAALLDAAEQADGVG
ncbi:amino acid adenylation domain-containing protein [Streptomyces sp. NPDC006435]|uniref:amino acid adenylation domain-containing protein n=1 Tax=Streptomyces sp. NPDC006435 TaxID=3154300 RepID=UPI0033A144B3